MKPLDATEAGSRPLRMGVWAAVSSKAQASEDHIATLIVDAFTGLLYPDDTLHPVRGVQVVEAERAADDQEQAEVWICGRPKRGT